MSATTRPGMAEVRRAAMIPIAAGESEQTRFDFRDLDRGRRRRHPAARPRDLRRAHRGAPHRCPGRRPQSAARAASLGGRAGLLRRPAPCRRQPVELHPRIFPRRQSDAARSHRRDGRRQRWDDRHSRAPGPRHHRARGRRANTSPWRRHERAEGSRVAARAVLASAGTTSRANASPPSASWPSASTSAVARSARPCPIWRRCASSSGGPSRASTWRWRRRASRRWPCSPRSARRSPPRRSTSRSRCARSTRSRRSASPASGRRSRISTSCAPSSPRSEKRIAAGEPINEEDRDFHLEIVKATQNSIFHRIVQVYYMMTVDRLRIYFTDPARSPRLARGPPADLRRHRPARHDRAP